MIQFILNFVVFVSGAVLMALEIVGSRVLAPYFGNSIFVWGSLISVFLAALSVGYYWGGRLSDRKPSFAQLRLLLFVPGVLIFVLPFLYPSVNDWIASVDFGIRLNPLIASAVYFLPPSIFLGTISPYAIRLSATALSTVGTTAGTLYALSTCGSILGTLFTAFYLIPVMGVSKIIHSLGLTMVALCLVSLLVARVSFVKLTAALAILLASVSALCGVGWAVIKTLLQKDSVYHQIRVEEDGEARYLYFNRTLQSAMNLHNPTALRLTYTRYASISLAFVPEAKRALIIGLGGGSLPKKYQKEFPNLHIDVAEIDPEVVAVAKKYFAFSEAPNLRVYAQDGRLFLTRAAQGYDLIMLDAYYTDAIPFHLTTREFFQTAERKLNPNGIVMANVIGAVTGSSSRITRSVVKTLRQVFPQVYLFPTRGDVNLSLDTVQNVIIIATKDNRRLDIEEIVQRAQKMRANDLFPNPITKIRTAYHDATLPEGDVPVLTDDYAPTDNLLHPD
jgi:spermidine synthase